MTYIGKGSFVDFSMKIFIPGSRLVIWINDSILVKPLFWESKNNSIARNEMIIWFDNAGSARVPEENNNRHR
jgi:hypothetical protein